MKSRAVVLCVVVGLLGGCALPVSGKRDIKCTLAAPGVTIEWESKVSGEYPPAAGNITP